MRSRSSRAPGPRSAPVGALDAGLRLLGRRAHARVELGTKLRRRGYAGEDVDRALDRLAELGYLDDRDFAAGHVRRRQASRGPMALTGELAARGVARAVADGAVAGFGPEAQLASARLLAERLSRRSSLAGFSELLNTVGPKLLRRGFSRAVARAACEAAWRGTRAETEA